MSQAAPPVLTVRYDGSQRTFAAGHDVVVGRDLRADMRITHPLISRAHLLLRFDQGRWLAIDNGSLNGTYVNGRRVPVVDIHDGQSINIGNPDGPQLAFEVGHHAGTGRPAAANRVDARRPIGCRRPARAAPRRHARQPGPRRACSGHRRAHRRDRIRAPRPHHRSRCTAAGASGRRPTTPPPPTRATPLGAAAEHPAETSAGPVEPASRPRRATSPRR